MCGDKDTQSTSPVPVIFPILENKRKLRDATNTCRQTTSKLVFLHPADTGAISWVWIEKKLFNTSGKPFKLLSGAGQANMLSDVFQH